MADREIYEVLFSMRSTKKQKGKEELHNSDIPGSTISKSITSSMLYQIYFTKN